MKILAIDTSSRSTGVALAVEGKVAASSSVVQVGGHSENLFAQIDGVLKAGGISRGEIAGIAVTRGPGSFTGLRVGIATAKGLAFGLGVRIVGVSSLRALASGVRGFSGVLAAAVDAKKGQVYAAAYDADGEAVVPERAWEPEDFAREVAALGGPLLLTGSGAGAYADIFRTRLGDALAIAPEDAWEIDPAMVAFLGHAEFAEGRSEEPSMLSPVYLRRSEAEEKAGIAL